MFKPVSTYRIQFHKGFTLVDFETIIPYLSKLGIRTIYASPIFESTPGSMHGYDAVNPLAIDPEIGTLEELEKISKQLHELEIGWIQDIVPNHMAFHPKNGWLMDVLEKGDKSDYKDYFDFFRSENSDSRNPIMVPFLGSDVDTAIENGELTVVREGKKLKFRYFETDWPINEDSYAEIWAGEENSSDRLKAVNKDKTLLKKVAGQQNYRLCSWQETDSTINYRRFFTVNGLICLNMQNPVVFEHYHRFTKELLDKDIFQGLRIDHIDGLYDPAGYLEQLKEHVGKDTYVVVEKILEADEEFPEKWPVEGTTGYDYLALLNNLFTYRKNEPAFNEFYHSLSNNHDSIDAQLLDTKRTFLYKYMGGELENLTNLLFGSNLIGEEDLSNLGFQEMKNAIAEFLVHCHVYRFYGNSLPFPPEETKNIRRVFNSISKKKKNRIKSIQLLEELFIYTDDKDDDYKERLLHFYQRTMQFSGPLMAKGMEDTLMYVHSRFIGHNEVGDSPDSFGISISKFHREMIKKQEKWPLSINATSTHDTKRGEDVRARLNVLTGIGKKWFEKVEEWQELNKDLKQDRFPDGSEEYFIYQTLVGSYPMPGEDADDYENRILEYLQKAFREAKQHSDWADPDESFERSIREFTMGLLDQERPFWQSFTKFHKRVSDLGIANSLAQVLIKFTSPGVPDLYQGCELWDFSLVDPDNRRAVDYSQRDQWLEEIAASKKDTDNHVSQLWKDRTDGKIKLWLVQLLLNERKKENDLFTEGEYVELNVIGKYRKNVIAFARRYKHSWYIVIAPVHLSKVNWKRGAELANFDWDDTTVVLPAGMPEDGINLLTRETLKESSEYLHLEDVYSELPIVFLKFEKVPTERSAGLLMPVFSLPSDFGIGDFGSESYSFVDVLSRSFQRYWQVLPLNPTESGSTHSPYSSYSSMAGNTLLISPEMLADDGYLTRESLLDYMLPMTGQVDYEAAEAVRKELFDEAWERILHGKAPIPTELVDFCEREGYWLHDFAIYSVLKDRHDNAPWYEWPEEYKMRDPEALRQFVSVNRSSINKTQWLQYVFFDQWKRLKQYANAKGVELFGDLPFYVNYDSVDVWANGEIFSLDADGNMEGVAGVPPDYFNADGQLWGMPVFKWDTLKKQGYSWWIQRIKKNLEMYDLLRLDHFRAFSAYWEVPNGETTAVNGKWMPGPGKDLFKALIKEFGELPFVAEDLGDIDDEVYKLRDEFRLPGMKVLQFAFGDDLPVSANAPHNYTSDFFVYTGTHDNNTIKGWYKKEASPKMKYRLSQYLGYPVNENNVNKAMMKMAYASVAKTAIIPVQDLLNLGKRARTNSPATTDGNWLWRLSDVIESISGKTELRMLVELYGR